MATQTGFSANPQLIPVFDGKNFELWSIKMRTMLRNRKLWDVVQTGISQTTAPSEGEEAAAARRAAMEQQEQKDLTAIEILQCAMTDEVFSKVAYTESAKEMWDKLREIYQGDDTAKGIRIHTLRRDFDWVLQRDDEPVRDYVGRVMETVNQLWNLGDKRDDSDIVHKVLMTLNSGFESAVPAIMQSKPVHKMTLEGLLSSLVAHEAVLNDRRSRTSETALVARTRNLQMGSQQTVEKGIFDKAETSRKGKKWCGFCKKDNHDEAYCYVKRRKAKAQQGSSWKSKRECFNCRKVGHIARDYKVKKKEQANAAKNDESDEELILAVTEQAMTASEPSKWMMDSGSSNHLVNDKRFFISLDPTQTICVEGFEGTVLETEGKGDIAIVIEEGKRIIHNVYYMPHS